MEHSAFKNMIDIAAHATNGVTIPNHKQTQQAIIDLFKNLTNLWKCLNVHHWHAPCLVVSSSLHWFQSKATSGCVNLTCDTWQASNTDGYFTMTGHWIKEPQPGVWELHSALLGFVCLNNAHNGVHLGQALFKVVCHVRIEHKVSHRIWWATGGQQVDRTEP